MNDVFSSFSTLSTNENSSLSLSPFSFWLLAICYGNSCQSLYHWDENEKERERNVDDYLLSLDWNTNMNMTTTIKSSFLIDDLLSAFKRPTPTAIPSLPTPSHPPIPTKEPHPIPINDISPISLNFFQPPNQFNQYAAIKPELHPFFFHGKLKRNELNIRQTFDLNKPRVAVIFFLLHVH